MIGRLAELDPDDVVLEIGPGPRRPHPLPRRPRRACARGRARPLARAAPRRPRRRGRTSTCTGATRSRSTSPPSTRRRRSSSRTSRTTSRRPSSPRASTGLPSVDLWCVMVQREVADRFFAAPSTKAYGAVSVLVQLAARAHRLPPRRAHRLPAAAERRLRARRLPARRRCRTDFGRIKTLVEAAFAHRRKTLPNSLALAGLASREQAAAALEAIGRAADDARRGARAARSSSRSPRRCERADRAPAPAKLNLALVVGPRATTASTRSRRCCSGSTSATASRSRRRRAQRSTGFAGDTLVRAALTRLAGARRVEPRWRATIDKRIPVAAGLGGGSSDAATALRLANDDARRAAARPRAPRARRALGADVPFFLADGPQLGRGDGRELEPLDLPQDFWVVLVAAERGARRRRPPPSTERFDERDGAARLASASARALERGARRRPPPARPRRPAAERPRLLAARRRAARPRRLPGRRQRRRPGRLRPLPPPPRTPRRRAARSRGARPHLADRPAWYG